MSLRSLSWLSETSSVDQAGLELRDSACPFLQVLVLKVYTLGSAIDSYDFKMVLFSRFLFTGE